MNNLEHNLNTGKTDMQEGRGYVYVLSNPSAIGLVKVGYSKHGGESRGDSFYRGGTGLPTPYQLEFELLVADARQVERNVHLSLAEYRVNKQREWFDCLVGQAINEILKYGMPDYDLEILEWPDRLDIRAIWQVFDNTHNKKLIARGYFPVTQEQFAESAYRFMQDFDELERRIRLVRDPNHIPSDADRATAKEALKELTALLEAD